MQGTAIYADMVNRLNLAKTWLTNNGYTILHIYMVWCQGESDGDANVTADTYKSNLTNIVTGLKTQGVEKCLIIRIGEDNGTSSDYTIIMNAQNAICKENSDFIMISMDFESMLGRGEMKDSWHYYQDAYNEVGSTAGYHAANYRMFNRQDIIYDPKNDAIFYTKLSR
jgi:hypothetical protein